MLLLSEFDFDFFYLAINILKVYLKEKIDGLFPTYFLLKIRTH